MTPSIVTAREVYPLRLLVLRPGGNLDDCIFSGDEDQDTVHFASKDDVGNIVGIASFYRASHPNVPATRSIQLRGMATHPDARGSGYGKELVRSGIQYFRDQGYDVIWCNAREVAISFYASLHFDLVGEPFLIPGIGPHRVMWRKL